MQRFSSKIMNIGLIILVLFLLTACPDDDNNPENNVEIIPLEIGNIWTYQYTFSSEDDSAKVYYESVNEVVNDTLVDDKTYYLIEFNDVLSSEISLNGVDGFYFNNLIKYEDDDVLQYKYPCEIGDTWDRIELDELTNQKTVTVVKSLNAKVIVPYGEFECIEYERNRESIIRSTDTLFFLEHFYLKPGLGLIKSIQLYKNTFDAEYEVYRIDELMSADIN